MIPVYPGWDTVLAQLCETVPQGEMGKGYAGSLCIISYDTRDSTIITVKFQFKKSVLTLFYQLN